MKCFPGLFLCLLCLSSCEPFDTAPFDGEVDAYVPVYAALTEINAIAVEPARPTDQAGKIYAYGAYIFQNELYKGIHIINNSNRSQPSKIAFLKVPFSTEIAVKGNYLYTNNHDDILVFDISNPANPVLAKRLENIFPPINQTYPPFNNVAFECPDPSKGVIVRWDLKRIKTPNCRR